MPKIEDKKSIKERRASVIEGLKTLKDSRGRYKKRRNSAEEELGDAGLPEETTEAAASEDIEEVVEFIDEEIAIVEDIVIDHDERIEEIEAILEELGAFEGLDEAEAPPVEERMMRKARQRQAPKPKSRAMSRSENGSGDAGIANAPHFEILYEAD